MQRLIALLYTLPVGPSCNGDVFPGTPSLEEWPWSERCLSQ
jgi:hypothetical protein